MATKATYLAKFEELIDISGLDASVQTQVRDTWDKLSEIMALADVGGTLDGYVTSEQGADGYLAFFTGADAIAGDNDLFWDRANNRLGIGTSVPQNRLDIAGGMVIGSGIAGTNTAPTDGLEVEGQSSFLDTVTISGVPSGPQQMKIIMEATKDIEIDGFTDPRMINTGVMRFEQKPAIENTRALTVNLDNNSQANSHAMVVNHVATGLSAGEVTSSYDVNIDTANSTGGVIRGFEMSVVGLGSAVAEMMYADPGVIPITQLSGSFGAIEKAFTWDGTFTDVTSEFSSSGVNVTLFAADNDIVYIGMDNTFNEIEFIMATHASGSGIKPVFEFLDNDIVWNTFTPVDETQGLRQSGVVNWEVSNLSEWSLGSVNSVTDKYWIRITRTKNSLTTAPVEELVQVITATTYQWNALGNLSINNINCTPGGEFYWDTRSRMSSSVDGNVLLTNNAADGFGLLKLGGTTNAFPALKRSGTLIQARLADDSTFCSFSVLSLLADQKIRSGADSAHAWAARSEMYSPVNGDILFTNNAVDDFNLLQFGGTTDEFPALKRVGRDIHFRQADDNDYASVAVETLDAYGEINIHDTSTGRINFADINNDLVGMIEYNHDTNSMRLSVNNSEAMRIASNGEVKIGAGVLTATRVGLLHVGSITNASVQTTNSLADELVLESSGHCGLTILSGATSSGSISFADTDDNLVGLLQYNHDTNYMRWYVNNAEAMRIDSDREVKIGAGVLTSTRVGLLHVGSSTNASVQTTDGSADELVLESSGHCGMTILSGTSHFGRVTFADTDDNVISMIQYSHSTNSMDLFVNNGYALTINSSRRVLMGSAIRSSTRVGALQVGMSANASVQTTDVYSDELVLEGSGSVGMTILSGASNFGRVTFADTDDNKVGMLQYNHDSNYMELYVNNAERMRIASDGEVKIGVGVLTSTRAGLLHVGSTTNASAQATDTLSDELVLESNGHCGLTILSGASDLGRISFADTNDNLVGMIEYNHNTNYMRLYVNNNDAITINSAQQVGIGTIDPKAGLHVIDDLMIGQNVETDSVIKAFRYTCGHYTNAEQPMAIIMGVSTSTTNTVNIGGGTALANAATVIIFTTTANSTTVTGTERMRIVSDGEVKIGAGVLASTRVGLLHVGSTTNASTQTTDGLADELVLEGSGSVGMTILSGASNVGRISFADDDDNLIGMIEYNHANNSMRWFVNNAEVIRINSSWRVGIGATAPAYKLDVKENRVSSYAANFFNDGNATTRWGIRIQAGEDTPSGTNKFIAFSDGNGSDAGGIQRIATGTPAFFAASDERIKEDIAPTKIDGLSIIDGLELFEFRRVKSAVGADPYDYPDRNPPLIEIGWVAQQAAKVWPEMVTVAEEGTLCVSDGLLIPVLTKAVQELSAKLEETLAKLEEALVRISQLEAAGGFSD